MDFTKIRELIGEHLPLALYVARNAVTKVRPGGTVIFMSGTGARRPAIGMGIASALTAALPALAANLALEIAPVRVTESRFNPGSFSTHELAPSGEYLSVLYHSHLLNS